MNRKNFLACGGMLIRQSTILAIVWLCIHASQAQTFSFHNMYAPSTGARLAKDLSYSSEVKGIEPTLSAMQIYKPDGTGPFPALVLLHTCGGLQDHVFIAAKNALQRGYVVYIIDSFTQRSVDSVCMSWKNGVTFARGVRDVLLAAEQLRTLSFVSKNKVAMVGFSWGGIVGLLAANQEGIRAAGGNPFNAVTVFYPVCQLFPGGSIPPYSVVSSQIKTPLLVLMGGKDTEAPPEECLRELQPAKQSGAAIHWHIYENAYHVWDSPRLNGFRKVDRRGTQVEYHYDVAIADNSYDRMFTHFDNSFINKP